MKRYPICLQDEVYSCGAYSILMILKYLHIEDEVDHIKQLCRLDFRGISLLGLIECLKYYHIEAKGYEVDLETLKKHTQYPCILHTQAESLLHYIVLYRYQAPYFICGDPAQGLMRYTLGELSQIYQNKAVVIEVVAKAPPTTYQRFFDFVMKIIKMEKSILIKITGCSLLLSILTLLTNQYFKFVMDGINQNISNNIMLMSGVAIIFVLLQKGWWQKVKNTMMIHLEKRLQRNILFTTFDHLLDLPMDYHNRYLANDSLNKMQTLFELPGYLIEWIESLCVDFIQLALFIIAIYLTAPNLFIGVGTILGVVVLISYLLLKQLDKKDKHILVSSQKLMNSVNHYLHHQQSFLVFKLKKREEQNKEALFTHFCDDYQDKKIALSHYQIIVHFLLQFMSVVLFYQGYQLILKQHLTIGELMLAYSLVSYLVEPLFRVIQLVMQSKRMSLIYERYKSLHIKSNKATESINGPINTIAFNNMSFAFGYRKALFEHQDELFCHHLQVVGDNGSGKTTFLKLITGQLLDYRGSIKINQAELRNIGQIELQEKICFLNGESFIADMHVLDFLINDNPDYQPRLYKLMSKYQLTELYPLLSLTIDGHGQGLSQGQLQLIAFVRVVLLDYEMYVFDEAFSHMSDSLKDKVRVILNSELFKHKLVLVVDHQTNIVSNNESCVIISKGSIHIGVK